MPHCNSEPADPDQACNNTVCNLTPARVRGEPEPQASLNDGECQDNTSPPYVQSRPDGSAVVPYIDEMVDITECGLEEEGGDNGESNDGVIFMNLGINSQPSGVSKKL